MTASQQQIQDAVRAGGVWQTGHFIFADGGHSDTKLEMDALWDHVAELSLILQELAHAKDLPPADVILGVPTGGQRLALELARRKLVTAPVAHLERVPGGAKQDFRFSTPQDEQLARGAKRIRIYEDVVSTLSSVAGVVRLLDPSSQDIHSLAIWRRGTLRPEYLTGVTPHFLVEQEIPSFTPNTCPVCSEK